MHTLVQAKGRSAWQIQVQVIKALMHREVATRFGKYKLGFIWMLVEPLLSVIVIGVIIGGLVGRTVPEIPYAFFLLNGRLLLQLFTGSLRTGVKTVGSNQGLMAYKTVRPLDPFIARFLFQFITTSFSFVLFCIIGAWCGVELSVYYFHMLLISGMITWLFGCGMGLIFGVAAAHFNEVEKVVIVLQTPLLFVSAVLMPLSAMPAQVQDILIYNPLVHTIEQSRKALFPFYDSAGTGLIYPFCIALIALAVGLIVFQLNRNFLSMRG